MVLSNAERQKRFQQRLRARAAAGVTPDMVVKATRLMYEYVCEQSQETSDWDAFVASARRRGGADRWREMVPSDPNDDYTEFGNDESLIRAVAVLGGSFLQPPKA